MQLAAKRQPIFVIFKKNSGFSLEWYEIALEASVFVWSANYRWRWQGKRDCHLRLWPTWMLAHP